MEILKIITVVAFLITVSLAQPPAGCKETIDLAFLVDNSASIREGNPYDQSYDNWKLVKNFVVEITTTFTIKRNATRIALARFSTNTHIELRFTDNFDAYVIENKINSMKYSGENTNTAAGLKTMNQDIFKYARKDADKILVILSDGLSNINADKTLLEGGSLKISDVHLFTVALTNEHDQMALTQLASHPAYSHHLAAGSINSLHLLIPQLVPMICGFEPPPLCPPGQYFDGELCTDCQLQIDLAILMDNSGSIRDKNPLDKSYDNFRILQSFIQNLVNRLPVGHNETRIGIIKFSTTARIELNLNSQYDPGVIEETIEKMEYIGGHTNTGDAIRTMREQIFKDINGDRKEAKNVAILITDGESSNASQTLKEAKLAKLDGVRFFTVGITNQINETELKLVASSPVKDHFYNSTNFHQLNSLLTKLIKHVCRDSSSSISRQTRDLSNQEENFSEDNGMSHILSDGKDVLLSRHFLWSITSVTTLALIALLLISSTRKHQRSMIIPN